MQGWISLHRKIRCHPFYKERRKFSKFEAWVDMLLEANHTDKEWIAGNEIIPIERGSFVTSEIQLMERWKWSKSKVRAFLKLLEVEKMIVKKTDTKKTTIYIVNYDNYQHQETTKRLQKDCKKTAKEPQKDTTNNVDNDNNDNNDNKGDRHLSPYQEIVDLYHQNCHSLPKVKVLTDKRKDTIRIRWKKYNDLEIYRELFAKAEASDFLTGRSGKWTSCNFDWLLNETNMVKVLEGSYDNKASPGQANTNEALRLVEKYAREGL